MALQIFNFLSKMLVSYTKDTEEESFYAYIMRNFSYCTSEKETSNSHSFLQYGIKKESSYQSLTIIGNHHKSWLRNIGWHVLGN